MEIVNATGQMRPQIIALLQSQKLPSEDLPSTLSDFYTALHDGSVTGVIGMERYGSYGLLRSMVVHPDYRNLQIAGTLVNLLEEKAFLTGITTIYLLTETAEKYFERKGYEQISREEVPELVKGSSEFRHVCPVSAVVMKKNLSKAVLTLQKNHMHYAS